MKTKRQPPNFANRGKTPKAMKTGTHSQHTYDELTQSIKQQLERIAQKEHDNAEANEGLIEKKSHRWWRCRCKRKK